MAKTENEKSLEDQLQEKRAKDRELFIEEFQAIQKEFGYTVTPKITLTADGLTAELEVKPTR